MSPLGETSAQSADTSCESTATLRAGAQSNVQKALKGCGGTNYNEMENNFQALKTTGILCSPIAEVDITAMGYVDVKLHIQVKYEDSLETDNHGYIYFKNDKGEEIHCIANIAFSTDSEHQERYVEYVYDLSDVDLTQYKVYGYFVTSDTHIEGNWSVTFPLESISQ